FARVDLKTQLKDDSLVLTYQFEELPVIIPFVGGKKTDQDGLILGPAASSLNFAGRDIRLEAYARTTVSDPGKANEFQGVAGTYWLGNLPMECWLQFIYTDSYNPFLDFPEKSQYYLFDMKHRFAHEWASKFKAELLTITTKPEYRDQVLTGPSGLRDIVPRIGMGIVRDSRESRSNPHRGLYGELLYTQSGGPLGGDASYGEFLGDLRAFVSLGERHVFHVSLLGQYRMGTVGTYDRFYLGGTNTLRAYHPVDDGFNGASEILSFVEYRYEFFPKMNFKIFGLAWYWGLQAVTGFDVSYVWDKNDFDGGTDGRSFYIGTHILMPGLDRIRLELGNKAEELKVDMGFTFGLFERSEVQRWRIR
ncbi:BamA/TamA family outer membrane protein, partial [Fibrobacterota bacterium]